MEQGPKKGAGCPWGQIQTVDQLGAGIWKVTTMGHGGIYVALARYGAMPAYLKIPAKYAGPQWFEEDCEWALVALAYPGCFQGPAADGLNIGKTHYDYAVETVKNWYPETWAQHKAAQKVEA